MSDFPSIEQLKTEQGTKKATPQAASLQVSSQEVEEKLEKKMGQVAQKQKESETERYAADIGVPYINLERFPISQEALRQVPKDMVEAHGLVCFFVDQGEIRLGAKDPRDPQVEAFLSTLAEETGAHVALYTISEASFNHVLKQYATMPVVKGITKDITVKAEDLEKVNATVHDFAAFRALLQKQTTSDLVVYILGGAFKLHASDVHVEAEEERVVIRFRLDGILHDAGAVPKEAYKKLVSRIKLVSSLKMNITDQPQDGRFTIKLPKGDVDVRVSTIPTVYGESIVMRLLEQNTEGLTLEHLGIRQRQLDLLHREIKRPNGMIITTGPTGSGKTTTLYAVIHLLNKPGVKIITLEDPVEYRIEGVNQSQIDTHHDYTFAKGLKSMLRQDPDIAMVGEIRDLETADIAIQAALTGHLILSTTHTNNAAGTIPRFLSMGVKPFLLAPALNAVVGQRLVRKICPDCRVAVELNKDMEKRVQGLIDTLPKPEKTEVEGKERTFYTGKGCSACQMVGYTGRIGIYEVFAMSKTLETLILNGNISEFEIEKMLLNEGMTSMAQDGVLKALEGVTSIEEVFRVTQE